MQVSSYSKWVLSGEHSVVRGGKAIAFPLKNYKCSVNFEKNVILNVKHSNNLEKIFINLIKNAAEFTGIDPKVLHGSFEISSNIPMNAGLGSSAAICSNIAKLFKILRLCDDEFSLAKNLENAFHKKSSGLDTSVAITSNAIVFQNGNIIKHPQISFWPNMILTYSGKKLSTSASSQIVKNLFSKDRALAEKLDEMMQESVNLCEYALENGDFYSLKSGIQLGNEAFEKWGLINEQLEQHIKMLKSNGAIAAKPVGSGLGGYVVSLWDSKPNLNNHICLTLERP